MLFLLVNFRKKKVANKTKTIRLLQKYDYVKQNLIYREEGVSIKSCLSGYFRVKLKYLKYKVFALAPAFTQHKSIYFCI